MASNSLTKGEWEALRKYHEWDDPTFGAVSGQDANQVAAHHAMVKHGMIVATPNLDYAAYDKRFRMPTKGVASFAKPQTATKVTKTPAKRGRKGENVVKAFAAIPTTPVDVDTFAKEQGVSLHVLRQSKRFDSNPSLGKVRVAKDKATKKLMICRVKS